MKNKISKVFVLIIILVTSLFGQPINTDVSKKGTTAATFLSIV